ncbi:MAG: threonine dehydratase [Planctomycetota bacterium]
MLPTPQLQWPALVHEIIAGGSRDDKSSAGGGAWVDPGTQWWVKHENHTPTGAFKVRGGISFMDWLRREHPGCRGIVTATRGNHGQSQARAATAAGLRSVVVVPEGNAAEKNLAMRAFGADLRVHGRDFEEARDEASRLAGLEDLFLVPPFHRELVTGVATYAWELFRAVELLDTVYVPIGCGSGICGTIAVRDALGLSTKIVGVVSAANTAVSRAVEHGDLTPDSEVSTIADGIAVRAVVPEAAEIYKRGVARIVSVTDDEVAEAMRLYFRCTHNVAEGAGAAPLAALMQEREHQTGKRVAVILCGGNVDTDVFRTVLLGQTPDVQC